LNKKILSTCIIILIIILTIFIRFTRINGFILKKIYPIKFSEYVYKYSKENDVDPLLVFAIIKTESNFKKDATSKSGAIGLMQLMPETAKEKAGKLNINYTENTLYNPEDNIKIGISYYKTLLDYYNQNYILAFVAYNAGIGNVDKWIKEEKISELGTDIENIPFKETNMYVRKIINNYERYKELYNY